MEKITRTFTVAELNVLLPALNELKLCPALTSTISLRLNRMAKSMKRIADQYNEEVDLFRQRLVESKKAETGETDESKLQYTQQEYAALNREVERLAREPREVAVYPLSSKDFPGESSAFGVRKFTRQDATGKVFEAETHFYDHYLTLLEDLIADEHD